jgi:hypothetical protein
MVLLGRPRHRKKDDVTINVDEAQCEVANRIHLAVDMNQWQGLLNTAKN